MTGMAVRIAARHVRQASNPIGKKIYINQDQAEYFDFPYYGEVGFKAIVAADTLINSLLRFDREGYDQDHLDLLEPLGGRTLAMTHNGHGWYTIVDVF